jgi:hypothetical protein
LKKIKKYNFIILPPEGFYISIDWPFYRLRIWFQSLVSLIEQYKENDKTLLIKYRSKNQGAFFPIKNIDSVNEESYGSFLKYCNKNTIVIGPLGSACIEALLKNIKYYAYDPTPSPNKNKAYCGKLNQLLYTAIDKNELFDNLKNNKIYKHNYSKDDLLYSDGIYLDQIVELIISNKND